LLFKNYFQEVCKNVCVHQGDQKNWKNLPNFSKSSQKSQNTQIKSLFESRKHQHQNSPKQNIYNKPCFETTHLCENIKNVTRMLPFLWATSCFKKIPQIAAQLAKIAQCGHPGMNLTCSHLLMEQHALKM
jgi:hypothetical protein